MIKRILIIIVIVPLSLLTKAQENIDSPISVSGIGDIQLFEGGRSAGMGSASMSLSGSYLLNTINPAGISGIDSTNLIFDVGVSSRNSRYSYRSQTEKAFSANFARISVGLRFTKKWAAAVSVKPFSTVSYHIDKYLSEEGTDEKVKTEYEGSGGINQVVITNSYKISDRLSIGADMTLLFGSINRTISVGGLTFDKTSSAHSAAFNAGLLYKQNLTHDLLLSAALIYGTSNNFIFRNEMKILNGTESIYDKKIASTEANIPGSFGAGLSLSGKRLLLSADMYYRKKMSYDDMTTGTRYADTKKINIGIGFTPSVYYPSNYLEAMQYQAGVSVSNSYLIQGNSNPVNLEYSAGAGLPLRSGSQINVAFSWGKRGIQDTRIISENYFRISLGFSLVERMFVKRLYD
jgi:hypothetical protein